MENNNSQQVPFQPQNPPQYTFVPYQKLANPIVKSSLRDLIFAMIFLVISIISVSFSLWGGFRLGFSISYLLLFIASTVYLYPPKKLTVFSGFCGVASLAASAVFAIYSDAAVNFWLFVGMVICTAIYYSGYCGTARHWTGGYMMMADVARTVFAVPLINLPHPFRSFFNKQDDSNVKFRNVYKVLIGLAVAIPLLIIILPLLISSDAAFEGFMQRIFGNISELIVKIFVGVIISPIFISLFFALKKDLDKPNEYLPSAPISISRIDKTIINTVLSVVSAWYVIYLLAQIAYFFNTFSGILPENYTFSDYARRGFFEMCAIAVINLIILFLSLVLSKRGEGGKVSTFTKILCSFITAFTMLLIATAFSKMYQYIQTYGLTRMRVLTSCFMVVLFIFFIAALIRIFASKFPYMKVAVCVGFVALIAVGFVDVDTVVSKYDVEKYKAGELEYFDASVFEGMSDSCVPYLVELMELNDGDVSVQAETELQQRFNSRFNYVDGKYEKYGEDELKNYNYSIRRAEALMLKYADRLKYDDTDQPYDYYNDTYDDYDETVTPED